MSAHGNAATSDQCITAQVQTAFVCSTASSAAPTRKRRRSTGCATLLLFFAAAAEEAITAAATTDSRKEKRLRSLQHILSQLQHSLLPIHRHFQNVKQVQPMRAWNQTLVERSRNTNLAQKKRCRQATLSTV